MTAKDGRWKDSTYGRFHRWPEQAGARKKNVDAHKQKSRNQGEFLKWDKTTESLGTKIIKN